jgi:2-C-methyl-D-erythritol 4-phosphate cytidylyltransferase
VGVTAIVVAAGTGTRFGGPKQFARLRGGRVVDHAVATAAGACDDVVLVLPGGVPWDGPEVSAIVIGGATRSASVRAGLAAVPEGTDIVVVHDAARPLATGQLFHSVIAGVREGALAVVPGVPVPDTLKRVDAGSVVESVDRDELVAVQTPQAFRLEVLQKAHASGGEASDDAALVEAVGEEVRVVAGETRNVKLTTALDLELLAGLLGEG